MRRRILKILKIGLLIVLALAVLSFLFLCFERVRGKVSLARYKRDLRARHEAVVLADFVRPPMEGTNAAAEVTQASPELIKGVVLPDHYPPRMSLTPAGRAIVGFRLPDWAENKVTYSWEQLASELRTNQAVLERIRKALAQPGLDNRLDYSSGPKLRFSHLAVAKSLTYWYGSESQLDLHENRLEDCQKALVAEIDLLRFLESDRIVISELVRIAIGAISRNDTWTALQADGWKDAQLARIQEAWERSRFLANFTTSLEGERVFATTTFDLCRASNEEAASMLFWSFDFMGLGETQLSDWEQILRELTGGEAVAKFLKKQIYCRAWRFAWLDQCELKYLERIQRLVEISRLAEKNQSFLAISPEVDTLTERSQKQGTYEQLRFPTLLSSVSAISGAIGKAMRAETERSLALTSIALKRYSLENTNPPAELAVLVPRFLEKVPTDYMDGKPIKYRIGPQGAVLLYSVGEDGIDDLGDSTGKDANTPGRNPWSRKDFVWPSPALPEEIEVFQTEAKRG